MNKINVSQIGIGYWGPNLLRALINSNKFNVKLVSEISNSRKKYVEKNFNNIKVVKDYKQILKNKEIDAVVISTPANTHFKLVIESLNSDKHVLVEKPLAFNLNELNKIYHLSKRKKKIVMVGHTFLYNDAILKIKKILDKNIIGKIRYIYCQRLNLGKIRSDINVIWNLAPHDVSIIQFLLNDIAPKKINSNGQSYLQKNINDVAFLNIKYPNNIMANIHVSWLDPSKVRKVTIIGTKKMIVFDDMDENKIQLYDKGYDKIFAKDAQMDYDANYRYKERVGKVTYPKYKKTEPLLNEVNHFAYCITKNIEPRSSPKNSINITKILSGF